MLNKMEMIDREKQRKDFEKVVKPLIEYINNPDYHHPHTTILVTPTGAEILEGTMSMKTMEFVKD